MCIIQHCHVDTVGVCWFVSRCCRYISVWKCPVREMVSQYWCLFSISCTLETTQRSWLTLLSCWIVVECEDSASLQLTFNTGNILWDNSVELCWVCCDYSSSPWYCCLHETYNFSCCTTHDLSASVEVSVLSFVHSRLLCVSLEYLNFCHNLMLLNFTGSMSMRSAAVSSVGVGMLVWWRGVVDTGCQLLLPLTCVLTHYTGCY